jgi:hypothetical protein
MKDHAKRVKDFKVTSWKRALLIRFFPGKPRLLAVLLSV